MDKTILAGLPNLKATRAQAEEIWLFLVIFPPKDPPKRRTTTFILKNFELNELVLVGDKNLSLLNIQICIVNVNYV